MRGECHAAKLVDSIDYRFAIVAMTRVVAKPHNLSEALDRFSRDQRRTKPVNYQTRIAQKVLVPTSPFGGRAVEAA
jgi:hypothetical protein